MKTNPEKKKHIIKSVIAAVGTVLALTAVYAAYYYITFLKPNVASETELFISRDYTPDRLLDTLYAKGTFINDRSFARAAVKENIAGFKPGHYVLSEGMSNRQVVRTLVLGWETPVKFLFRGYVKTLPRLASVFAGAFEADSAEFASVLGDKDLIDSLGFDGRTFIGMFIPNTYEMYWTSSPEKVILRMKKEYDAFWNEERCAKAAAMGFDRNKVMTLASIVIGETNNAAEMPVIAGVYMNRLRKGMKLQACPTVIYAHLDREPGIRRVLSRHLTIDSPYNTYKYPGLPPGPIAVPTIAAIDAVLNYAKTDYLYFAAKPEFDGTHNFATTYQQHLRNGRAYQEAYRKREAARRREAAGRK